MIYYSESNENLDALLDLLIDVYLEANGMSEGGEENETNDKRGISEM